MEGVTSKGADRCPFDQRNEFLSIQRVHKHGPEIGNATCKINAGSDVFRHEIIAPHFGHRNDVATLWGEVEVASGVEHQCALRIAYLWRPEVGQGNAPFAIAAQKHVARHLTVPTGVLNAYLVGSDKRYRLILGAGCLQIGNVPKLNVGNVKFAG